VPSDLVELNYAENGKGVALMKSDLSRRNVLKLAGVAGGSLGFPVLLRAQSLKAEYKLSVVGNRPLGTTEAAFRWAELVAARSLPRGWAPT